MNKVAAGAFKANCLSISYPKDPADCLIGATALVEWLSLVTADKEILKSKAVPTIW